MISPINTTILAERKFGSRFYFDGVFKIPTKEILDKKRGKQRVLGNSSFWFPVWIRSYSGRFFSKDKKIKRSQGSQGMECCTHSIKLSGVILIAKIFFIEGENIFPDFNSFVLLRTIKRSCLPPSIA